MTTRKSNVHIDNYIDAVCSGEILVSKDVASLMVLVEQKLTQENGWIDEVAINQAIESIEKYFPFKLFKCYSCRLGTMVPRLATYKAYRVGA
ncbi:hypothetical protein [Lysinibacillus xylanilyticus]|uniref:hypothetical protein n=1 Tax=Lysinibacillus xylanilyticus TaxID=582475 RepID=UPI003816F7B6